MYPKVCAVIPTRNRKDITLRFLESFSKQSYINLDTVIVDANSTDGTQDAVVRKFPKITLINVDDNSYWTASTNRGVELALRKGYDFILTINDDSNIDTDYVANLVQLSVKNNILILGSRIDYMLKPGLIWSLGAYSQWGSREILQLSYHTQWADNLPSRIREKDFIDVDSLPGNGVLIHRSVFEQIGIYDEFWLPHYHSDSEFIMRAIKKGIPAYCAVNVVVYNDCPVEETEIKITTLRQLFYTYFKKKSHLFFVPIFYLVLMYCPFGKKLLTLMYVYLTPIIIPFKDKLLLITEKIQKARRLLLKLSLIFISWLINLRFRNE
ncbi:glycosyltransferase family 2 protein [Anabaena azotica]|uniref:Glycosyltransferase family 2 protein n=1 Tax=Anabaena azotica FACHB-119 TaxID=947527 RepID=A0ABR8D3P6_9NOST|nr:glycosyltransferase family 2 protein [Anabaena azotica]MBD2501058.1 glycosyltransferase family 2 protein [Anabaena azotica FACHB-119]